LFTPASLTISLLRLWSWTLASSPPKIRITSVMRSMMARRTTCRGTTTHAKVLDTILRVARRRESLWAAARAKAAS